MSYRILNNLVFFCQKNYFINSLSIFDDEKLERNCENYKLDHTYLPFISFLLLFCSKKLCLKSDFFIFIFTCKSWLKIKNFYYLQPQEFAKSSV